ncbi:hypothetical protein [Nostoc sp. CENA543]|uniref:hypothetical protein n=1 Tax=Nostoc sp. CENA543 TaxID=1869241 RepID=UPI0012FFDA50|nr:hypothetical protein [Nostoc sp. CENA543]
MLAYHFATQRYRERGSKLRAASHREGEGSSVCTFSSTCILSNRICYFGDRHIFQISINKRSLSCYCEFCCQNSPKIEKAALVAALGVWAVPDSN